MTVAEMGFHRTDYVPAIFKHQTAVDPWMLNIICMSVCFFSVCGRGLASVHTRVNAAAGLVLYLRGHRFDLGESELLPSAAEDVGALHQTIDQDQSV